MTNEKLISVVIPCYNHEKYIKKTISSVLQQTYTNIEVLVADDCSTDSSAEVLKSIHDPRVKLFLFEQNRGTVFTLNFLLKQTQGEYVATLGSDDCFVPDKLEKQLNYMENHPEVGAVFSWASIIDGDDKPYELNEYFNMNIFQEKNRSQGEWIRYFFEEGNHLCHSSALIRRTVQEKIGLYCAAYRQLHDFEYWLRILCDYPIHILQENLTLYRRIDENSSVSAGKSVDNLRRIFNEYSAIFCKLMENIGIELFLTTFSDMLSHKWDENSILEKEKYVVLRQLSFCGCGIPNSAQDYFVNCVAGETLEKMLPEDYRELLAMYYTDTAKVAIEYPISSTENKHVTILRRVLNRFKACIWK